MRLYLGLAAIDEQLDAVDERGIFGSKEENGFRDLFRLADTAGGNQACEIVLCGLGALAIAEQFVEAGRIRDAGADRIDADMAILQVEDLVACEVADRRFRG
jgi:hypothetical protein